MFKNILITISISGMLLSCGGDTKTTETSAGDTSTPATKIDSPVVATPAPQAFQQALSFGNISFNIHSPQNTESNTVTIVPSGLSAVNDSINLAIDGKVTKATVADISGDNAPELLIATMDANNRGHAYVFSSNKNKSLSQVNIEGDENKKDAFNGYNGEDEFELVETVMARRFPLFENGAKTGKMRQMQYKLKNGEAMKQLRIDKVVDF